MRPLGIPTIKDRVVQAAAKLLIEPIFEADFHDCSFGFRPNRNAKMAVERVAAEIKGGKTEVYDAGPSMKSVKKVCAKVKELTLSIFKPVKNEEMVQRGNKVLVGWGNYFQGGYPRQMFDKVNWYVRNRLYLHFNRKSQRGYALKYAPNFHSELQAMGLHRLQWRRK